MLANSPCSVGVLVDRGLNVSTRLAANQVSHNIVVLFFGGPDDREALSYAWRMSEHPGISLTVMRFVPGEDANEHVLQPNGDLKDPGMLAVETENGRDKQLDEEIINNFRIKNDNDESVFYTEKVVNNGEETVEVIRSMDNVHDLFIVGRGQGMISPLTAGLTDWSECPELGAIGDLLASSDFAATVSVLVVQQYAGMGQQGDALGTPDSMEMPSQPFSNIQHINRRSPSPRGQNVFSP